MCFATPPDDLAHRLTLELVATALALLFGDVGESFPCASLRGRRCCVLSLSACLWRWRCRGGVVPRWGRQVSRIPRHLARGRDLRGALHPGEPTHQAEPQRGRDHHQRQREPPRAPETQHPARPDRWRDQEGGRAVRRASAWVLCSFDITSLARFPPPSRRHPQATLSFLSLTTLYRYHCYIILSCAFVGLGLGGTNFLWPIEVAVVFVFVSTKAPHRVRHRDPPRCHSPARTRRCRVFHRFLRRRTDASAPRHLSGTSTLTSRAATASVSTTTAAQ